MDFDADGLFQLDVPNNRLGADALKSKLPELIQKRHFESAIVAPQSTSFYALHRSGFLSSGEELLPHQVYVHSLKPKMISNYKTSFMVLGKRILRVPMLLRILQESVP